MNKQYSSTKDYKKIVYVDAPSYCAFTDKMVYTRSVPPKDEKYSAQEIVVRDMKTDLEYIISAGGSREKNPQLTTDGKKLLFISNANEGNQIWVYHMEKKELVQVTHMRNGVENPSWSPSGDKILFVSICSEDDNIEKLQTPISENERDKIKLEKSMEPVIITDNGYKNDVNMGFCNKELSHIWVVSANGGIANSLTRGKYNNVLPVWKPDGTGIVFVSNMNRPRTEYIGMDLYCLDFDGNNLKRLTEDIWVAYYPKPITPMFTSDGKYVVCGGLFPSLEGGVPAVHLYRVRLDGSECIDLFTENSDLDASCFLYNGEGGDGGKTQSAQISSCDQYIYFQMGKNGAAQIFRAKIFGEKEVKQLTFGNYCIRSIDKPQNGKMAVIRTDFLHPQEIYFVDELTFKFKQLTFSNPWMEDMELSKGEDVWIDTLDGKGKIHGFAFPPQGAKQGKKYPTILYIHGGPSPFYGYAMTYEHQAICGEGFGLVFCNPRGSSGYTKEHAKGIYAFDGTAYMDILQFTEACVNQFSWIDKERLGVTGGSYGGYMTNWIIGHSQKFKAAVTQRSISNQIISYANSDMAGSSKAYESFTDFQIQKIEESPVAYADKINIPLLILHSEKDMRCTQEHAHQLFVAVKDFNPKLPVRLVMFPNSNHSMVMGAGTPGMGTLKMRLRHYDEMIDWFKEYL